ncbi:SGNH/GDSL hydrolase family protein [Terriglobus sp. TAA 43]|uniref:SGNH/GDSL hydrolase family protein n=1 Tax=Terriglobus sp. TAA 43 TaxID=278961 RepID=UPI000648EF13|nr:SGNH/GDSL hydrolase family protein [Terriglobus sp. TAA 43]
MAFLRSSGIVVLTGLLLLCSCGLPPTLIAPNGPLATYPVHAYVAVGDSITYGAYLSSPTTQSYPALIAYSRHWTGNNYAIGGDMACDVFPRQITPNRVAFSPSSGAVYSILIGTNDADTYGIGDYDSIFSNCQLAAITWLATRPEDKLFPGDTSVIPSGACTNSVSNGAFTCLGPGALDFGSIKTTGAPLYLWYTVSDAASSDDTFTVSIDGTLTTLDVKPRVSLTTGKGSTSSIYLLRAPLSAGLHHVQLTTRATNVSILALASNRSSKPVVVAVGDIPNQLLTNPIASVASQLAYTQISRQNVETAISDGLDVRAVNDRDYMLGTSAEMHDQLHPNFQGQVNLAVAFASQLP